ncbi:TetR/AcrR family transcriptional regulator [Zunongwangia endophytica]|uniref:TetR/AcrR family transcriptional regulator n=1 Tax=Zunongwangia endophytica TaxID=1808945 RepID=A0ABV8HAW2_9FLAO|nr:TetR/AcrR family transcriptional regulator [Zunongwangia endophytica]MDN3593684.1 TetR/AcrR family transcriptional regulator [Zunongwangia endophytica]
MKSKEDFVRKQVVAASQTVFKKYGFKKATMAHISKASGKGRSTLYYYFKNKNEVFEAFVKNEYETIIIETGKIVSKNLSIEENLSSYRKIKLEHYIKLSNTYTYLLTDLKENTTFLFQLLHEIRTEEVSIIENCLTWAIEKKEITPVAASDLNFLALAIVTATESLEKEIFLYQHYSNDMFDRLDWINQLIIKGLQN